MPGTRAKPALAVRRPRRPSTADGERVDAGGNEARPRVTTSECIDRVAACVLAVSVIIPARNCAGTLGTQLAALAQQRFAGPWELIIVDNGCTDATSAVARAWVDRFPVPLVIARSAVRGVNRARNAGSSIAGGEILAFCDGDDEVTPGWLAALVEAIGQADLVGGPLDEDALNPRTRRARRPPFPPGRLPRALDHEDFVPGANLAIRASVLRAVGGFDEAFVLGQDDVDLSWRVRYNGFDVAFAAEATVAYRHRNGAAGLFAQFVRYGRAEPLLYRRHRRSGLRRAPTGAILRRWAGLVRRIPRAIIDPAARGAWIVTAAFSIGRIIGSVEHRARFL